MKGKIAQRQGNYYHVALLVETSHEFGREVLRGIRAYEKTLDNHWMFYLQPDGMRQDVPRMGLWPCTGVIARLFSKTAAWKLLSSGIPLVLIDPDTIHLKRKEALAAVPYVTTDTGMIVKMAFDHLYDCGCRTFAFVHSVADTGWSVSRGREFKSLALQHGCVCHVYGNLPARSMSWECDVRRLGKWLAKLPHGLGFFAAMDQRGRNVIEACREAGRRVPDDVMVLGVDNDPLLCEMCEPSMSSIALDACQAGFEAAKALHVLMQGGPVATDRRILVKPTHVSRRTSTASSFSHDPVVAEARRYIYDRFHDKTLQILDIARHCGVSRRLLETRFSQTQGRTLLQALTEVRMERARTLLCDTDDPVTDVAAASGFADANYFTKSFRMRHGDAPLKFRERMHIVN